MPTTTPSENDEFRVAGLITPAAGRRVIDFPAPRRRARVAIAALFLATVAIWAYAGFAIGETRGRGWRDAMLRSGCQLACPPTSAAQPKSKGASL